MSCLEKKAVFRCDASPTIGSGHVMRCLTLADALAQEGWQCVFLCTDETAQTVPALATAGYKVKPIDYTPGHATLLIVDHYELDHTYEGAARRWAEKILVIDDLADRKHDCDILLDQTYGRRAEEYSPLVPGHCAILTGPHYALLRPQFTALRPAALTRRDEKAGKIDTLLVSLGGTNIYNITATALKALDQFETKPLHIDVVLGRTAPYIDDVKTTCEQIKNRGFHALSLHHDVQDMARLMAQADLSIGAGGTTSWERCCLGLPTIMIEIADNQHLIARQLHKADAVYNLGWYKNIALKDIVKALDLFCIDPQKTVNIGQQAALICNGTGSHALLQEINNAAS